MNELNALSRQEIARRLSIARKLAGRTQEEAAKKINVSSSRLASIEKGSREIHLNDVDTLAYYYGTTINQIMRKSAVYVDLTSLVPRSRKQQKTKDAHAMEAVRCLHTLAAAEVELERLFKIERKQSYPKDVKTSSGDTRQQAEFHADKLRKTLSLGSGPISNIFAIIREKLGIRLYRTHLSKGSKVSGLYAYDREIGACMLLNANQPLKRQCMSAAHELGHFHSNREHLVLDEDDRRNSREENYADMFSVAFLMPKVSFSIAFNEICKREEPTIKNFQLLAEMFNVTIQACVLRLEDLKLIGNGTWNRLKSNFGFNKEDKNAYESEINRKGRVESDIPNYSIPLNVCILAYEAWDRALLSEGQLSNLLRLDRIELRNIILDVQARELSIDEISQVA